MIDKASNEGQLEYVNSLVAAIKTAVTSKSPSKVVGRRGRRKGRKETMDSEDASAQRDVTMAAEKSGVNWGLLEPLHKILEPVLELIRPFVTSQVVIAVLFMLLAYTWVFPARSPGNVGLGNYQPSARMAAYEELWRREESALWDWLEDRVGLDEVHAATSDIGKTQKSALRSKSIGKRLLRDGDDQLQLDDAIRTTEEKLLALKQAVQRRKSEKL